MIKKLLNLTIVLVLAAAAKTSAQTSQRITEVNTLADLLARRPVYTTGNVESVSVRGYSAQGDWGQPKVFRYESTNALTTNAIRRATVTGVGRWVHDWDGDASLFVMPSTNDCGVALTIAAAEAATRKLTLKVLVPGDYYLKTTNGFQYGSGSAIKFGDGVWLVGNYEGSSGGFADPAQAYVRNSGVTGWPADGEVSVTVSNVIIEGLKLRGTGFTNYGFVAFGVGDAQWRNFQLKDLTAGWSFNVAASNILSGGHVIRTEGAIYQDGVHIIGGSKQLWYDLDIHSGDDAIAIGGPKDIAIRDIIVQNAIVRSQYAHAVRVNQERANSTNKFERISFSNITGQSGLERNGQVRIASESTNIVRPFYEIHLDNIKVTGRSSGPPAIGVDYGFYIEDVSSGSLVNSWSGETVYQNLWVVNSGSFVVNGFRGLGSRGASFNQTARFTSVDRLSIDNSTFLTSTTTTNTGIPLYIDGVGSLQLSGSTFVQLNSGQHAVLFDGAGSTNILAADNVFQINGAGSPFGFSINAANVLLRGNVGNGTNIVSWAGGITNRPNNAVIVGNHGAAPGDGAMNSLLPGRLELAANVTDYFIRLNRPGIGTADIGLTGNRLTLVPSSGSLTLSAGTAANTSKSGLYGIMGYGGSDSPLIVSHGVANSTDNTVNIGGGSSQGQAATTISFYGAISNNISTGSELGRLFGTVNTTNNSTPLYLLHSNTVKRVWATNISGVPNVLYIP